MIFILFYVLTIRQIQVDVQNASNIAAAIHKFLGGVDADIGTLHENYSDDSDDKQQVTKNQTLFLLCHFFAADAQH